MIMVGCLSERYRETLSRELPEIDGFLGNKDPASIVALLEGRAPPPGPAEPRGPMSAPTCCHSPGART